SGPSSRRRRPCPEGQGEEGKPRERGCNAGAEPLTGQPRSPEGQGEEGKPRERGCNAGAEPLTGQPRSRGLADLPPALQGSVTVPRGECSPALAASAWAW